MDNNKIEKLKNNSNRGGARENAGRPKGSENKETKKKRIVEKEFKERILRTVNELLNSQMSLAKGVQMLYCIEKDGEGKNKKPRLVTSQSEIEGYLAGETDGDYYFITTERPDNRALDSLLDRVFGKPVQPTLDTTPRDETDIRDLFKELKQKANDDDKTKTSEADTKPGQPS